MYSRYFIIVVEFEVNELLFLNLDIRVIFIDVIWIGRCVKISGRK